jgi:hypothetical protein
LLGDTEKRSKSISNIISLFQAEFRKLFTEVLTSSPLRLINLVNIRECVRRLTIPALITSATGYSHLWVQTIPVYHPH